MLCSASAGKSFHLFALMVLAPWAIASLCGLSRRQGGLHWAVAGALGAAQVLVYPGYLTFAAPGILAVVTLTWWWQAERTRYVLHLAGIAAVTAVLSAWYVVPFLLGRSRFSTGSVSDRFESLTIAADPGQGKTYGARAASASATGVVTSRFQSQNATTTDSPVSSVAVQPSRVQAGRSSSTAARPTSHGTSGGYSEGAPGMIASALLVVTV